jgi:hypothetical protein
MGTFPPSNSGDQNAQRRSQRVIVKVSVMVLAEGADKKSVSEETRTVTVNAHGAMILLGLKVSTGQLLTLRNSRTGEEIANRPEDRAIAAATRRQREMQPSPQRESQGVAYSMFGR